MKIIDKAKEVNTKFNSAWTKFVIGMWVVVTLAFLSNGFGNIFKGNESDKIISDQETEATTESKIINYKNCSVSTNNQEVDRTPLKTNLEKGDYDLIVDTQKFTTNKNDVNPINNPLFLIKESLKDCISESEDVLSVKIGEESYSYPKSILLHHLLINQKINNENYLITYSPYSDSFGVYKSDFGVFGISGRMIAGNVLIFDTTTESLWLQLTGKAIIGDLTGNNLDVVDFKIQKFYDLDSNVNVLSFETGFIVDYSMNPFEGFSESTQYTGEYDTSFEEIQPKNKVIGVIVNDKQKAYTEELISNSEVIDEIDGQSILIKMDNDDMSVYKYEGDIIGDKLNHYSTFFYTWKNIFPNSEFEYLKP